LSGSVTIAYVNGVEMYELNLDDKVSGVTGPTSGTITLSDNGQPINGCSSIPGTASGSMLTARCTEYIPFNASQSDTLFAQFSGDSVFGDSTSNANFVSFG